MEERKTRKKNILLKGMKAVDREIEEEIRDLIKEKLGIRLYVRKIRPIGGGIVDELELMKNKIELMKNKSKLGEYRINNEDDYTAREKEVQKWTEMIAEEEGRRIRVEGVWNDWLETQDTFRKQIFQEERKRKAIKLIT